MATYSSFGIIWRENEGDIEVLLLDQKYTKEGFEHLEIQTKFPGGKEEPEDRGNSIFTLKREILEETSLVIVRDTPEIIHPDRAEHPRYFFLIHLEDCTGELRKHVKKESGSILYPPYWVSLRDFEIEEIFYTHRDAFLMARAKLLGNKPYAASAA